MARYFLVLGILLLVKQVGAATSELTTQLQRPKRYQITALAQSESNLYETEARQHQSKGRVTLAPSYKFHKDYRATLSAGILQEFSGGREGIFTNAKATVTRIPIKLTQDTSLIPVAGLRLPTNVMDRKKNSYQGSVLAEMSVLTNWTLFDSPFTTVYGLYLNKNVHEYTRAYNGKANLDYSVINYFGVEKYILPKLSILIDGDYTYARTYQNSLRTLFSIGQSLTYEFNNDLSVTVGHTNGGDALTARGTDYDISVFDENTSVVYANVRAIY